MNKIKIEYDPLTGNRNHIFIEDLDIAKITTGFSISAEACQNPQISINCAVSKVEISITGQIQINNVEIPEIVAKGIYKKLHERFGQGFTIDEEGITIYNINLED